MPQDLDGEGMIKGAVFLSRRWGRVSLFGNIAYSQDPEGDDHRGEVTMGSLVAIIPSFTAGIDARARSLVFSSDEKHDGLTEPVIDFLVGPLVHYLVGPVALTGQVGMSTVVSETHGAAQSQKSTKVGPFGLLSAGLAL